MSDQVLSHLDESIEWKEYTSKNGKAYKVGVKKADQSVEGKSRYADVHWEVGDNTWKETSAEVKDLGISRYALYEMRTPLNLYMLRFTTTKGWTFTFVDEGGDSYICSTGPRTGDHYATISSKLTIIRVEVS